MDLLGSEISFKYGLIMILSFLAILTLLVLKLYLSIKKNQELTYRVKLLAERNTDFKQQLDEQAQQSDAMRQQLESVTKELHEEQIATAQLEVKNNHLKSLQYEKSELQRESNEYQELLVNANQHITELEVRLSSERRTSEEKSQLFVNARDQLKQEFQYLANKIFEAKTEDLDKNSRSSLTQLLNPLKDQLGDFKRKVEDVYDKETRDRQALYQQIDHLKQLNQQMSQDALNLTQALKGDSKVQGNWGEVILERILEESGLRKGFEYETQVSLSSEGKRFQPDVIIRLPDKKDIIVDAKVSLTSYERHFSETSIELKEKHLANHVQSVRNHIRGLSGKGYEKLESINTLDYVLLFIPIEAAFILALDSDKSLFRYALQRNIVIVSPSTLLVTLRTIRNIWRFDQQSQNAQLIASRGADLYDKFVGFIESMDELGKSLSKAQEAYDTSYKRLTTGKGNLVNQAVSLTELGVSGKKTLPDELLQTNDLDLQK